MKGWILYKRSQDELTSYDHGVNRLMAAALDLDIELDVYKPEQFELVTKPGGRHSIIMDGKPVRVPDFVIPRMGAETSYYALALIRQLEFDGVYSLNTAQSVNTAKDKMHVCQLLTANNLPTPKTMLLNVPVSLSTVENEIGFPLVMKTIMGARGVGVHLCENFFAFKDLLGLLGNHHHYQYIAQEFIANSYGRDLRVLVLGGEVIGCMQRIAKESFKANYSLGGDVALYEITPDIERFSLACARLVGLELAGIDLLFGEKGFYICEANSSPGFKGMELASGEDIAGKILMHCLRSVS